MNYREDIQECYSSIMEQEKMVVNMSLSMGFTVNIKPLTQTLDVLKIMLVFAWEKNKYGSYKDFFHGKELETKYLDIIQYPTETIVNDFKKYLKLSHVKTIFDDDVKVLEKMEIIISSLV